MDWVKRFYEEFKDYYEVKNISKNKVHGSLKINFCDGVAHNYELTVHRRKPKVITSE